MHIKPTNRVRWQLLMLAVAALLAGPKTFAQASAGAAVPAVGTKAPDFSLKTVDGTQVSLAATLRRGPVVLVVGRGYPGYQCPFCTRQFGEIRARAKDFEARGATVLWIYPGATDEVRKRGEEFLGAAELPSNIRLLLDPGYAFTLSYGLRWDAPRETAYPATLVIDRDGIVRYALVSREHGGRAPIADVLAALPAPK
ncbi:MAG: peroxiredoxin family protein [Acidobacteriota bacterium]|nr:peroxiredoxin family protein [Acidobacteriota bacterium]